MNTLQAWVKAHPGVNVLALERNADKSFGFGDYEEVCGFCLASHYFGREPPEFCKFCRAPLRETQVISDLPSVRNRIFHYPFNSGPTLKNEAARPFIIRSDKRKD